MNAEDIRRYCLSLKDTTEKLQWGDALCFKVRGKMFAVLGLDRVRITFKATPEQFAELVERQHFRPSPYLARHHWVLLERLDAATERELRRWIGHSYELVEARAPAARTRREPPHGGPKPKTGRRRKAPGAGRSSRKR